MVIVPDPLSKISKNPVKAVYQIADLLSRSVKQ
jgi:hypothetical protein